MPEQHLTDLAVGHFEDQLAKSQAQVRGTVPMFAASPIRTAVGYVHMSTHNRRKYDEREGRDTVQEQQSRLVTFLFRRPILVARGTRGSPARLYAPRNSLDEISKGSNVLNGSI